MSVGAPISNVLEPGPAAPSPRAAGWLRSPGFDLAFVLGLMALAFVAGGVALVSPSAFMAVLLADLWLLAYPHVASTFTRIAFDRRSRRAHVGLLLALPPVVLGGTAAIAWLGGVVALNTVYFYWQTYHYARQSYGIARAYRRGGLEGTPDRLTDVVVLGVPAWGLLHRAAERHAAFYGAPFLAPPVPWWLAHAAGLMSLGVCAAWLIRQGRALAAGRREQLGLTLFVASHVLVTMTSYVFVRDVTSGWLFVNVWHNAQYLLFVWAANARRFGGGVDPERRFVSWISQPQRALVYAAVCLGLGTSFYLALGRVATLLPSQIVPVVLTLHLAVNFHHYLVDAFIWRRPRAPRAAQLDAAI